MKAALSQEETDLWLMLEHRFNGVSSLLKLAERLKGATASPFIVAQSRSSIDFCTAAAEEEEATRLEYMRSSLEKLEKTYLELGAYVARTMMQSWAVPLGEYLETHSAVLKEHFPPYHELARLLKSSTKQLQGFCGETEEPCKDCQLLESALKEMQEFLFLYLTHDAELESLCRTSEVASACP